MNGVFDQISSYERGTTARIPVRLSWWTMLVVSPMIIAVVFGIYTARGNWAIAKRQQTTYGTIIARQPSNHDRYQYTFLAKGKPYTGSESPTKNKFEPGQRVLVYYDPHEPSTECAHQFRCFRLPQSHSDPAFPDLGRGHGHGHRSESTYSPRKLFLNSI